MSLPPQPNAFLNELELNKLEPYIKIFVNGYIRKQNELNDDIVSQTIPKVITLIILAFYVEAFQDSFDPNLCGSNIEISNNKKTIGNGYRGKTQTCYGKTIIPSTSIGTYVWRITLLSGNGSMNIGIDNAKLINCNKSFTVEPSKGCYAYNAKDAIFTSWEHPFGEITNYPNSV